MEDIRLNPVVILLVSQMIETLSAMPLDQLMILADIHAKNTNMSAEDKAKFIEVLRKIHGNSNS